MNLPKFLIAFFQEEFNGAQVAVINANWYRYTSISLSNSSREELLAEARSILALAGFGK